MTYVSHADLGGATGYGPIENEPEGVVFHSGWEERALALNLAAGAPGGWNIDRGRSVRETLPDYAELSYYEIWFAALERLVVAHGLATEDELVAGHAATPGDPSRRILTRERVGKALANGRPVDRDPEALARFQVGDRVRTRAGNVDHHTRLPAYAAGRVGTIERIHGVHVFPDTHAHGLGEQPQWLYTVVFDATEVWDDAAPGQRVSVDAWESYLSPAEDGL
ncbi:MAG TPA: nitrile hydratase subunit beta [Acidimicrobiia bacterium]|nr:nitrile hydratase subunit beta [Acidimicrobiia bacterium]